MSAWDAVLAAEPGPRPRVSATQFETALAAMGDFADLKSSYTAGHSRRVSSAASAAARRYGLSEAESRHVAWSGLLHDLGRAASRLASGTARPLTDDEWERVRLHPYFTERVLARSPSLARLGVTAGLHHERLDGSGYHRGATASQIEPAARLLAAADMYCALTEQRAHRRCEKCRRRCERVTESGSNRPHRLTMPPRLCSLSEATSSGAADRESAG